MFVSPAFNHYQQNTVAFKQMLHLHEIMTHNRTQTFTNIRQLQEAQQQFNTNLCKSLDDLQQKLNDYTKAGASQSPSTSSTPNTLLLHTQEQPHNTSQQNHFLTHIQENTVLEIPQLDGALIRNELPLKPSGCTTLQTTPPLPSSTLPLPSSTTAYSAPIPATTTTISAAHSHATSSNTDPPFTKPTTNPPPKINQPLCPTPHNSQPSREFKAQSLADTTSSKILQYLLKKEPPLNFTTLNSPTLTPSPPIVAPLPLKPPDPNIFTTTPFSPKLHHSNDNNPKPTDATNLISNITLTPSRPPTILELPSSANDTVPECLFQVETYFNSLCTPSVAKVEITSPSLYGHALKWFNNIKTKYKGDAPWEWQEIPNNIYLADPLARYLHAPPALYDHINVYKEYGTHLAFLDLQHALKQTLANPYGVMSALILHLGELSLFPNLTASIVDILGTLAYALMVLDQSSIVVLEPFNTAKKEDIMVQIWKPPDGEWIQVLDRDISMIEGDGKKPEGIRLLLFLLPLSSEQHHIYAAKNVERRIAARSLMLICAKKTLLNEGNAVSQSRILLEKAKASTYDAAFDIGELHLSKLHAYRAHVFSALIQPIGALECQIIEHQVRAANSCKWKTHLLETYLHLPLGARVFNSRVLSCAPADSCNEDPEVESREEEKSREQEICQRHEEQNNGTY